ncbi:hypothetical protein DYB30_008734 [Aphanomyces astaci]|uniref:Uncharacterized protein n=1 Tax=Aphanomyces astaci TaxID=112090 RepID=A0A397DZ85_APHAT|nr:hypothetical protein DYB38_007313 [Aphanomyces astaci]RHY73766.1 hypothetical protein DYB30_008734 [Aphanomyces astaci]
MDIRTHLLSSNSLDDFQLFTMVLVSIKLFLRSDELVQLKGSDICYELTVVDTLGFVEAMAFVVQGKCDKAPVTLMLWSDETLPVLCPIRHLFVLIGAFGISSGGFLFGGKTHDHIPASTFHNRFKNVCHKLINRDGPFGTHSCRKTAYLFAVWGLGQQEEIMQSARHKQPQQAMKYKRDATFLLEVARANDRNLPAVVSPWKSIFCANAQMGRSVNTERATKCSSIETHAKTFLVNLAKCDTDGQILAMVERAMKYNRPVSAKEAINQLCTKHFKPEIVPQLLALVESYVLEAKSNQSLLQGIDMDSASTRFNAGGPLLPPTSLPGGKAVDSVDGSNGVSFKRKRGGAFDFNGRKNLKNIRSPSDKLAVLLGYFAEIPCDRSEMCEAARVFAVSVLTPIESCYRLHFSSNNTAFVLKWGNFPHFSFGKKCCNGSGECGTS